MSKINIILIWGKFSLGGKKAKSIGGKLRQGVIMVRGIDESYLNE